MPDRSDPPARLARIERSILGTEGRITQQLALLEQLKAQGRDTRKTETLLRHLEGLLATYRRVRAEIMAGL
jgi:hypothetical protein